MTNLLPYINYHKLISSVVLLGQSTLPEAKSFHQNPLDYLQVVHTNLTPPKL